MAPTSWTDRHDELVTTSTPEPRPASDAELERVWNRVAGELPTTRPRRRRLRTLIGGAIVVAVVGVSGVAVADLYGARTGEGPGDAEDLLLGGPGERLDSSAPDFGDVVREETTDIRFPSEASRERSLRRQIRDNVSKPGPDRTIVSTGAIRAWVAADAVCAWSDQWAVATRDGDGAARDEAVAMIRSAPRWPAIADLDPEPYGRWITQDVTDGERTWTEKIWDYSQFFYLGAVTEAASGTDPDALGAAFLDNHAFCWSDMVPHLPQADPTHEER